MLLVLVILSSARPSALDSLGCRLYESNDTKVALGLGEPADEVATSG